MKKVLIPLLFIAIAMGVIFTFLFKGGGQDISVGADVDVAEIIENDVLEDIYFIDINTHLSTDVAGLGFVHSMERVYQNSLADKTIVSPPPFEDEIPGSYDSDEMLPYMREGKLYVSGGGGTLNILIQCYAGRANRSTKDFKTKRTKNGFDVNYSEHEEDLGNVDTTMTSFADSLTRSTSRLLSNVSTSESTI